MLHANITVSDMRAKSLLPHLFKSPNSFKATRSLELDLEEDFRTETLDLAVRLNSTKIEDFHLQDLPKPSKGHNQVDLNANLVNFDLEFMKNDSAIQMLSLASIYSIMINAMPSLIKLKATDVIFFQFIQRSQSSKTLSGLENLRVLQLGGIQAIGISARSSTWIMVKLENLSHLQVSVEFSRKDERFLRDQDLFGKSRITHLDLSFQVTPDKSREWGNAETEVIVLFLGIPQILVELKLQNTLPLYAMFQGTSLLVLQRLIPSAGSLKYLCLTGGFEETSLNFTSSSYFEMEPVINIELKALTVMSLDQESLKAFINISVADMSITTPSLAKIQIFSGGVGQAPNSKFVEQDLIRWIRDDDFPSSVTEIFCSRNPIGLDGELFEMSGCRREWDQARRTLSDICCQKGLGFTLLDDEEQSECQSGEQDRSFDPLCLDFTFS